MTHLLEKDPMFIFIVVMGLILAIGIIIVLVPKKVEEEHNPYDDEDEENPDEEDDDDGDDDANDDDNDDEDEDGEYIDVGDKVTSVKEDVLYTGVEALENYHKIISFKVNGETLKYVVSKLHTTTIQLGDNLVDISPVKDDYNMLLIEMVEELEELNQEDNQEENKEG